MNVEQQCTLNLWRKKVFCFYALWKYLCERVWREGGVRHAWMCTWCQSVWTELICVHSACNSSPATSTLSGQCQIHCECSLFQWPPDLCFGPSGDSGNVSINTCPAQPQCPTLALAVTLHMNNYHIVILLLHNFVQTTQNGSSEFFYLFTRSAMQV